MPKPSLKDAILDAGLKVMFRTGYHGTSVRDVTAAAGAPQGSFTNHFRSKEAFASEVLDRYFDVTQGAGRRGPRRHLADAARAAPALPRHHHRPARGRRLWPRLPDRRSQPGGIGQQRDAARAACGDLCRMARAVRRLHRGGPGRGEIASDFEPEELADFLLASWQGAILRMKVERNPEGARAFQDASHSKPCSRRRDMSKPIEIRSATAPVLGSTMAYRETGDAGCAGRAVPARQSDLVATSGATSCRWCRRSRIASRPTSSASANPASPTSPTASSITSAISMPSSSSAAIRSAYLVAQDWGTALAFHLAARRPDFVRGLAFMEFIRPMPTWQDFTHRSRGAGHAEAARAIFRKFRTPGEGEAHDPRGECLRRARAARRHRCASSATTRWRPIARHSRRRRAVARFLRFRANCRSQASPPMFMRALAVRACGAGRFVLSKAAVRRRARALVSPAIRRDVCGVAEALRARSSRRRTAFSAGGSPRGDRPLRRRLDRRHRGGASAACGLRRAVLSEQHALRRPRAGGTTSTAPASVMSRCTQMSRAMPRPRDRRAAICVAAGRRGSRPSFNRRLPPID